MENFVIVKNLDKKEGSKQPDYKIRFKEGDEWKEFGGCWLKEGSKGKYFSCSKSKPMPTEKPVEKKPIETIDYPAEESNPDSIPF